MRIEELDYRLPESAIAQEPAAERDRARLLVLERSGEGRLFEASFADLPGRLVAGSLVVLNDTRVRPARLRFTKASGGRLEVLLLREETPDRARVLIRGRARPGMVLPLDGDSRLEILQRLEAGAWEVRFHGRSTAETLARHGEVPLPPYIRRPARERDRDNYQTVYARREGAVAAPTAGLHFTAGLLEELERRGIGRAFLTLHTGWGTFQPLRSETVEAHRMDPEYFELPEETAAAVNGARQAGRPVVAVGTTVVRTLEGRGGAGRLEAAAGWVNAFIYPGYRFRIVDAMVTNFHLPRTTTLLLTAAFAGPDRLLAAYEFALERGFRFGSYGDAMLII